MGSIHHAVNEAMGRGAVVGSGSSERTSTRCVEAVAEGLSTCRSRVGSGRHCYQLRRAETSSCLGQPTCCAVWRETASAGVSTCPLVGEEPVAIEERRACRGVVVAASRLCKRRPSLSARTAPHCFIT